MAEVQPLHALHYDLAKAGPLGDVLAPPYDVIDGAAREALVDRSEHNAVQLDLPEDPGGGDRYEHAARTLAAWSRTACWSTTREPAIWALEQSTRAPTASAIPAGGSWRACA